MKLLYPTSLKLDVQSLEGFSTTLVPYDVKEPIPEEHVDADVLVTANPGCLLQIRKYLSDELPMLHPIQLVDASIRGEPIESVIG